MQVPNRPHHGPTGGALTDLRNRTRRSVQAGLEPVASQRTMLTFAFCSQVFAAEVSQIREILDMRPVSVLPNAPPALRGLIDLRGESIAIVDLSVQLGLPSEAGADSRMIVFELGSGGRSNIGVIVDRVLGVVDVSDDAIEPVPQTLPGWSSQGVTGIVRIGERQVVLIDVQAFLGRIALSALPSDGCAA